MVLSSPERTSPALISLPALGGTGSDGWGDWADAAGAAKAMAMINAKPERLANCFVISGSVYESESEQRPLPHGSG